MKIDHIESIVNYLNKVLKNVICSALVAICFSLSSYAQVASHSACQDHYLDGNYVKAIECFSDYLRNHPKDADVLHYRALCYYAVGDYPLALSDLNNAIKNHNRKAASSKEELYTSRAMFFVAIEDYDEALKDYATAIKTNPKSTDALFNRANLYYLLENYAASDADWEQAIRIDSKNVNAQVGLARNMIARGEIEHAIRELDRLERLDFRNPHVYQYRSQAYSTIGNYRKAIDDLINWCYFDDFDDYNIMERAMFYYAEYEPIYAIAKVSEKVVNDSDNKIYWLYLRTTLYEGNEMYREAIEDYNAIEALISSPQISILYNRGKLYTEIGEYNRAIADFDESLKLQEHPSLFLNRARAQQLKGDYKLAIDDFTKVIELDPMNSFAYYMRGWTKEFDKDFQGALKDYTTSIELERDYAYTYLARGRLYQLRLDQFQLSEKDFLTVLSLENEITKSGNCRQYALFHLGRFDEAIAHQNAILEKHPSSGNYYDATCLFSLMNRPVDAIKYLQLAFEKGYRDFIHMENDIDLNNIRNTSEYIKLVEEWKYKTAELTSQVTESETRQTQKYVVKTKELKSGVYEMPCTVNDLPLKFIFDTGASDITISSLEAAFMLKNNFLSEYDFRDRRNYRTASGDIVEGTKVRLRKIRVGDLELNNIEASVVHNQNAPLLFGQSALGKFVKITIDNKNNEITFEY